LLLRHQVSQLTISEWIASADLTAGSKKCLAPPTKLKAKIDRDTSIERTDSFEKRKRGEEEDDRELHSLKQDILTKSGE